eukprot:TRINITY_DN29128_c0_g1_i1.p1 TRINITY_DN29128_c0_g1~~TRINITY_DN29128_c0_g1_i1.p1  ORF type:complete len:314 (+),score=85.04 TRINITY_DN29128_c0_g1_i1:65-1006(+)
MARLAVIVGVGAVGYGLWWRLRLRLMHAATKKGKAMEPAWLRHLVTHFMLNYAWFMGVRLESEAGDGMKADPSRQYMYVWHPHGFVSFIPSFLMGVMATTGKPHNKPWYGTCLPLIFNLPILGEIFTWSNARPVDRKTMENLLSSGCNIAVQPGGVKEQAASEHEQEQAFFPAKLGFIRMAMKYGVPLMPVYLFGENQLYKRVNGFEWLSKFINKTTGMTLPIVTAKWGLPQAGLLPRATPIHIRWGKAVEVGPRNENPTDEQVQEVLERYIAELQAVFDAHAKDCLPPAVAAKGLKIVRLENRAKVETAKTK